MSVSSTPFPPKDRKEAPAALTPLTCVLPCLPAPDGQPMLLLQALIPEALIPLTLAAPTGSSIVLAGDPRQMGPVVRCQYSAAGPALKDSLQQQWLRCTGE